MINLTELRIGNWIRIRGEVQKWSVQHFCALQKGEFKELTQMEPIVLEPANLEKYSVSRRGHCYFLDEQKHYYLVWDSVDAALYKGVGQGCFQISKVEHLHQLQNLYYAITSKELNIL